MKTGKLALSSTATFHKPYATAVASSAWKAHPTEPFRPVLEASAQFANATAERKLIEDICRTVVRSGGYRTAWVGIWNKDDILHYAGGASCDAHGGNVNGADCSSMVLPLALQNQIVAALFVHAPRSHAFAAHEIRLIKELSNILATGLNVLRTRLAAVPTPREIHAQAGEERMRAFIDGQRRVMPP